MKSRLKPHHVPLFATIAVFVLLYVAAGVRYEGFFAPAVFLNFFRDNSFLGLAAIGMTFVILSGGIDLSVGALIAFVSISLASLITTAGISPWLAIPLVVLGGTAFGAAQGALIAFFAMPPFLITLAGMFLARGLALVTSMQSVSINDPLYSALDDFSYEYFPVPALIFLVALALAMCVAQRTRFGRNIYAIGGSESSAVLMGVPVRRTKVAIYALSGLTAAVAGVIYTFYTASGNAKAAEMLELDAIAAVVIGGTLLSGGVGYVIGTAVGVLILGIIQTAITYEGTLSSWWTKIAIGLLLLLFIGLQKLLQVRSPAR